MQGGWLGKAMIHRSEHKKDFTVIDNGILRNTTLSTNAFRLLVFMLSCSDEWDFSITGISHQFKWDERKTMRIVKELKEAGYVEQVRKQDEKGIFTSCEWHIHEIPIVTKNHSVDKPTVWIEPQCGKTHSVDDTTVWSEPQCGKMSPIRNTNTIRNTISKRNTKSISSRAKFVPPTLEEVQSYCESRNSDVDPKKFFEYYDAGGWKDAKGNSVKNWKQKLITWEGRQNKTKPSQAAETPNNSKIDEALKIALRRAEGGIS